MKRRIVWKIVAAVCLVAMLLPTFSTLSSTPAVAESGVNPPAPLPYALDFAGQEHLKMYLTTADVTVDGTKSDSEGYVLLMEKTDGDDSTNGIFTSDGSITALTSPASEARPKYLRVYGSYDESGLNLYIEAKSRTHCSTTDPQLQNQSLLTLRFGTNFGATAANAYSETKSITLKFTSGDDVIDKSTAAIPYKMSKVDDAETITDSTGTYNLTTASYEMRMPWSELGFESFADVDIDRIYFIARYFFLTNGGANYDYWNYALPSNTVLLNKYPISEVFGEAVTAIPHVLELSGTKPAATYTNEPTLTSLNNGTVNGDNYTLDFNYALNANATVAEAGVIYKDSADIGSGKLMLTEGIAKHTVTLTEGKASFTHSFAITNYDTFVSFRPYVKYEDGTVIYGNYLTTSPNYIERSSSEFDREINVLMIGCSFNYYYLDELVSIAAADNIKINAHKAYYSGNPAKDTWSWLIHDGAYWQEFRHTTDNPTGVKIEARTLKQILEGGEDKLTWDFISVQDHYAPGVSKSYELCMEKSIPYLANTFRYLEATEPQATLLLHETWAYDADHDNMKAINATQETVNQHQANISKTIYKISESIPANGTIANYENMPIVPSGAAWNYARNGVTIGGTEYKIDGTLTKDKYHDGETQGGQYLNACVWYEVLTGNSCIGNTWRPVSYTLDEARALQLQQIAHQAVADLYGADYADNIPDGRQ